MSDETQDNFLTADDIFNSDDLTIHPVKVPEWGKDKTLGLRVMSGLELIEFRNKLKDPKFLDQSQFEMFALCAVDGKGRRLFFAKEDVEKLKQKNSAVFNRLQETLLQINGMKRVPKTWESLKGILEEAGVDAEVIIKVQKAWASPEDEAKNA